MSKELLKFNKAVIIVSSGWDGLDRFNNDLFFDMDEAQKACDLVNSPTTRFPVKPMMLDEYCQHVERLARCASRTRDW